MENEEKRYLECNHCQTLNDEGALQCKHCSRTLKGNSRTAIIHRTRKSGVRFGWKSKTSIMLLIFALVYLAAPIDILPMTFFDDIAIVVLAIAVWVVAIVLENTEESEWLEVREYA